MQTFDELEQYVENLDITRFPSLKAILDVQRTARIDDVACLSMPQDAPKGLLPIRTTGDGNCFACTVSMALFGNQSHHREI